MEKGSSFGFIAVLLALLVLGGGIGVASTLPTGRSTDPSSPETPAEERQVRLNITDSLKLVLSSGAEYKTGDVIKLPAGEKLNGKLVSLNDPSITSDVSYSVGNESEQIFDSYIPCSTVEDCKTIYKEGDEPIDVLLLYAADDDLTRDSIDDLTAEDPDDESLANFF